MGKPDNDMDTDDLATLHFTDPTPDRNRQRAKFRQFLEEGKIHSSNKINSPIEMSHLLCFD